MKSPVFRQLMQAISFNKFQKKAKKYDGDKYSKSFTSWHHLQFMIFFQMTGKISIRDGIGTLKSKAKDLYHSGIVTPSRNNLSHQNSKRDFRIFEETFYDLKHEMAEKTMIGSRSRFKFKMPVKSFDSSTISLCKSL